MKDLRGQLRRIDKLIREKRFRKALPIIEKLLVEHSDEPRLWVAQAICLSESPNAAKALTVLKTAARRFPGNHTVLYSLAETYNQRGKFEHAERTYRAAIGNTPEHMKRERSECYNGLGVALWQQHKRDDALDAWKLAIQEDGMNEAARRNLKEFTNEYSEPAPPSPVFDDPYHFLKIQTERYFKRQGYGEFKTKGEAERITGAIFQAWNDHLAPLGRKLDSMTAAEKTELFGSIDVDFTANISRQPHKASAQPRRVRLPKSEQKNIDELGRVFDFLPSGEAVMLLLIFGVPALLAAGMSEDRIAGIIRTGEISEEEEELFLWGWDLMEALLAADVEQGTTGEIEAMHRALEIAREELPDDHAGEVLKAIRAMMARYK